MSIIKDNSRGNSIHFFVGMIIIKGIKIEILKENIKNINDPRRTGYGNIRHKIEDIIIIGLCALICGGEDYADMEEFDIERE